jgi:propanol-preferring alcohol dehydrogenase
MLAARFKKSFEPLSVEEVEIPKIGNDEVLIKLKAAGICGSDVNIRKGLVSPAIIPITLGHEGAGVIEEVGENVTDLKIGDHVVIHYIISCGNCKPCLEGYDNRCRYRKSIGYHLDGTFAEYIRVPAKNVLKIADHIPFEWGAITTCAVATAYHAVKTSNLKAGDTVVVFGIGGVGLHAVLWARFFGASRIIAVDTIDSKLQIAKKYGADVVINANKEEVDEIIKKETDEWGVDIAIECSGSPKAMEQALKAIRGKNIFGVGRVISVGLQTEPIQITFRGLREGFFSVIGDHTKAELYQIIKLLEAGRISLSESITHRIALQEINYGIELLANKKEHVQRIVINF